MDYDTKIQKVERKLRKLSKKIKDIDDSPDQYSKELNILKQELNSKLKQELNAKLERNKIKFTALKSAKKNIINQIDNLVVKYKQFIEMEAGQIV